MYYCCHNEAKRASQGPKNC